jgi:diguanylate cyclase (GGDEF)-like protein/PAS domain S-box-containing protein
MAAEELWRALLTHTSDLTWTAAADGTVLTVLAGSDVQSGRAGVQAEGLPWDALVHPDDLPTAQAVWERVRAGEDVESFECAARRGDGTWARVRQTVVWDSGAQLVLGVTVDLATEQLRTEAIQRATAQFRARFVDSALAQILLDTSGVLTDVNDACCTLIGRTREELIGRHASELARALDDGVTTLLASILAGERTRGHVEQLLDGPNGADVPGFIEVTAIRSDEGEILGAAVFLHDLSSVQKAERRHQQQGTLLRLSEARYRSIADTETRRLEQELRRAALHDALTGLANRALLVDRLQHALHRGSGTTAVLMINLDHFKNINDSRGHASGDAVLVSMAERLLQAVRPQDTVSRFGGDAFVILLEDVSEDAAVSIAESVLTSLAQPLDVEGAITHVGASIGVALSPPENAADLLRFADTAMYAAKDAGRGQVRVFDRALADDAAQRFMIAGDLREALAENELEMHFQPIVDLQSGDLLGMEGVARWEHPLLGAIPPTRFVSIAEASGLGAQLDRWAIAAAVRGAQSLRLAGAVPSTSYIAIHLTTGNLSDHGLEDLIHVELEAGGLAPENLMLEITESSMMMEPERTLGVLRRLRARGYGLAIDDFGTGYSSLAYVRDLPVTTLKVDGSFVADIRADRDALAIVTAIVDLAHTVGVTAIAEGVETVEQCVLLRSLGCRAAQGGLWASAASVKDLLAAGGWPLPFDIGPGSVPPPRRREPSSVQAEHGLDRLLALHRKGASLATIAAALNVDGYVTPKGLRWHSASVARAIADSVSPLPSRPDADNRARAAKSD